MTELGLIFGGGVLGLVCAAYLTRWVLARAEGDGAMSSVAAAIQRTAEAYVRRQGGSVGAVTAVLGGAVFLAYGLLPRAMQSDPVPALELGVWLTVAFAVGAGSAIAIANVSTRMAARTSGRVATGARRSVDEALQVALRGGGVSALFAASVALLGTAALFVAIFGYHGGFGPEPAAALGLVPKIPFLLVGHALGAAFAALLTEIGGGTFSKAADLGADLASASASRDEDASENPATIVDLAGDLAAGAARATSIFAALAVENVAAMFLGAALFRSNPTMKSALSILLFPLVTRAFGLVAAIFGVMVVRTDDREEPLAALTRGLYVAAVLHAVGIAGASKWLLGTHWLAFFLCGTVGIGTSVLLMMVTQYYTDSRYRPVRELAEASRAGPTLSLLNGLASGLESIAAPVAVAALGATLAHTIGARTGLGDGGMFGVAVALLGLLGTAGYTIATSALGPIVDAAGGIVEMTIAHERPDVRGRTVVLDAVGNIAKAGTRAVESASAAIGSILLVGTFLAEVHRRSGQTSAALALRLDRPETVFAALAGIGLVLWLAARCLAGVVRGARRVLDEARRQAKAAPAAGSSEHGDEHGGAEQGAGRGPRLEQAARGQRPEPRQKPHLVDPDACAEMASHVALGHIVAPGLVAAFLPLAVGLALRFAKTEDNPLLAADSVAAFAFAGTIAGVLGSLLSSNAGSAWDNAKKYIVTGAHGGRHLLEETGSRVENPAYGAVLVADGVGDPLKDAAGPVMQAVARMLPVAPLVFLPFFL